MTNAPQALANALALHQAGQLAQAEQLYRQILHEHPDHDGALHSLGVLAWQNGDPLGARLRYSRVFSESNQPGVSKQPEALLVGQQRWQEAEACSRRTGAASGLRRGPPQSSLALKGNIGSTKPWPLPAGNLLQAELRRGALQSGAALTEQEHLRKPSPACDGRCSSGPIMPTRSAIWPGALDPARPPRRSRRMPRQALQLQPNLAPALNNLGYAVTRQENWTRLWRRCKGAQLQPDQVFFLNNLATALVRRAVRRNACLLEANFATAARLCTRVQQSLRRLLPAR